MPAPHHATADATAARRPPPPPRRRCCCRRRHRHCHLLSSSRRTSLLPHRLSSSSCCAAHSSSRRAGWLLRHLSTRCPLVVSPSRCAASRCLNASAGCRIVTSCCPLVVPISRPIIMLAGCCVASHCAALSSSRRSPLPTPLNAVERCCHHRTPPPPPPLKIH